MARSTARELLELVGLDGAPEPLVRRAGPVLPTVFRIDEAAVAVVGALSAAVAARWSGRGGVPGEVSVDGRAAQVSFRSERYLSVDGAPPAELWAPLSGDYRTADGWIRVHANFAHHAEAAVRALAAPADRDGLTAALAARGSIEAEDAIVAAGGVAGALRTGAAWASHPQGIASRARPVVSMVDLGERIDVESARPSPPPDRPLGGLRVLDLTRVIAGPVAGRVLAAHGADVLWVAAAHLPQIGPLLVDTGFGKRACAVDLRRPTDREAFAALVAASDVVLESYRPGALAGLGFGPDELAALRPGLVVVDVRAYSSNGPWAARRGFDSLVQMVSGIAAEGAEAFGADRPHSLPCQALDHATGWLAALGAVAGVTRRERTGRGSRVEVSLSTTAAWLDGLGRVDARRVADPGPADVADLLDERDSPFGRLRHVRVPGHLAAAPPHWERPPPRPGGSAPQW